MCLCPWPQSPILLLFSSRVFPLLTVLQENESALLLQGFLTENKQSLPFPLGKVLKSMLSTPLRLSDITSSAGMCAHTRTGTQGFVSHRSRVSLSYNKLCVHYWWAFWRSENLARCHISQLRARRRRRQKNLTLASNECVSICWMNKHLLVCVVEELVGDSGESV